MFFFHFDIMKNERQHKKNNFLKVLETCRSEVSSIFKGKFEYHICPLCMQMILALINRMNSAVQNNCVFRKTSYIYYV